MKTSALVIDDDEVMREFVSGVLEARGHAVLRAESGATGVELIRRNRPEVVICDLCMDGISGFDMLETLRSDPSTATIPFIMITSEADRESMRKGMGLGADDYLVKPFSAAHLMATVDAQAKKRLLVKNEEERRLQDLRANLSLSLPHELFTPLNSIVGFAEVLKFVGEKDGQSEVIEMSSEILKASSRLKVLMRNYVTYAQFEILSLDSQKVTALRSARCNDGPIVIRDSAEFAAAKAGRKLDLFVSAEEATISIRSEHLNKLVEELADNAFKFSKKDSKVRVEGTTNGRIYHLRFSDEGCGMSPEQVASIGAFMQFNRDKNEQQGLGLGLLIARRITEVYNGRFHIVSSPTGSVVTVELPCE